MADTWPYEWEGRTSDPELDCHVCGTPLRTGQPVGWVEGRRVHARCAVESRPQTAWEELQALRKARRDEAHEVVATARNHRNVAVLRRALRMRARPLE